ncbi:unnamed protein product [Rhizophagus irregularis]|nr:unnamed protein product [Rhizophagus irregularis]
MLTRIASREVGQDKDKDKDVAHFGKAFGKSLNLEHIPFTAQLMKKVLGDNVDRRPNWRRALEAFKNAGTVYKTKHNKLPVIVYDNISGLINTNPKVLDTLQDDAKMVKEASQEECSLVVPGHTVADDFLNGVINSQS